MLHDPKRVITLDTAAVVKSQPLFFLGNSEFTNVGAVSGVDLHVHGHIEGAAEIAGPLSSLPHIISGDVDWQTSGDYYESTIIMRYSPTQVTGGQLTFELTFH